MFSRPALPGGRPPARTPRGPVGRAESDWQRPRSTLDGRRARRGRPAARRLRALARRPPPAALARAPTTSSACSARATRGSGLRDLERGQPLRRADVPPPRAGRRLLPRHEQECPTCRILAAEVLDMPNMAAWVTEFRRTARRPAYWGMHNYIDANRLRTTGTRRLLKATKGQIWFTETGGIVARTNRRRWASPSRPRTRRGDALALRPPRAAQPPHHARLPLPLERGPGPRRGTRRWSARRASRGRPTACCSAYSRARRGQARRDVAAHATVDLPAARAGDVSVHIHGRQRA